MIRNDEELTATKKTLDSLLEAYIRFRKETLPTNPKTFALVAPSFTSEIAGLIAVFAKYLDVPVVAVPDSSDVAIRLKGAEVELGKFSAATVGSCLSQFQIGMSRIAVSREGRSKPARKAAKKAVRYSLEGIGPGSVVLYLSNSDRQNPVDEEISLTPEYAVNELLNGLDACSKGSDELAPDELKDVDQNTTRFQVFKTVYELMPSDPAVDEVEISFARRADETAPRQIVITRQTALRARRWAKQIASAGIRVVEVGRLTGISLSKKTFELSEREGTDRLLTGNFPETLHREMIASIEKQVLLTGILSSVGKLHRMEIEEIRSVEINADSTK